MLDDLLDERLDKICERFEQAWRRGERPAIETHLAGCAAAEQPVLLARLLRAEWDSRLALGEVPDLSWYLTRFAAFEQVVADVWDRIDSSVSGRSDRIPAPLVESPVPPAPRADIQELGYSDLQLLGEGGMGLVYRGVDPRLRRKVAIKTIKGLCPDSLSRFRIEAEALARLSHPHIVQVYNWERLYDEPCLVMEFVLGGTLADRLRGGRIPCEEAVRLVAILARAVQAAHKVGITHRDLKPGNVLMAPCVEGDSGNVLDAFPKIADFGLARLAGDSQGRTQQGALLGTPAYMAPEQASGDTPRIGPPCDVWALGVILYQALTGTLPLTGGTVPETLERVKAAIITPPRGRVAEVPIEVEAICLTCLARDPAGRPSAAHLAQRLEDFLETFWRPGAGLHRPRPMGWSRRRSIAAIVMPCLVLVLAGWWFGRDRIIPAPLPDPLEIKIFRLEQSRVFRGELSPVGVIGSKSQEAEYDDRIKIQASWNHEAHAYLLAYNTNGEEQLLWPRKGKLGDPTSAPPSGLSLAFPTVAKDSFALDDDKRGGVQAFALVLSREPLPAFDAWKRTRGPSIWQRYDSLPGASGHDRKGPFRLTPDHGIVRGSIKEDPLGPPLGKLVDHLSRPGIEEVQVIAFSVRPARSEP